MLEVPFWEQAADRVLGSPFGHAKILQSGSAPSRSSSRLPVGFWALCGRRFGLLVFCVFDSGRIHCWRLDFQQ